MSADTDACISCDVGWVLVLQPRSRYRPLFPNGLIFKVVKTKWSGRVDSNHRPPGPEPGALARLSHAPSTNEELLGKAGFPAPTSIPHCPPRTKPLPSNAWPTARHFATYPPFMISWSASPLPCPDFRAP